MCVCVCVCRSKPYRYAYSLAAKRPTNMGNALAKYDTHTGEVKLWHEDECAPGELCVGVCLCKCVCVCVCVPVCLCTYCFSTV